MSPVLRENRRTPAAYVGDANSLFWNFISFPHKPSLQARFQHTVTMNFQLLKLDLEKAENQRSKCQNPLDHRKSKRVPEKHLLLIY